MGFNLFFCQGTGIQLFLFVKDLENLLFSVSRLWKIYLFDCQVLWVQYTEYRQIRKEKEELLIAKRTVETILNIDRQKEQEKEKEKEEKKNFR